MVVDHLEAPGVGDPIVTIRVVVVHPVGHVAAEVALDAVGVRAVLAQHRRPRVHLTTAHRSTRVRSSQARSERCV